MKKIIPKTTDITTQNITQIAKLFPQVITEKEDENGTIVKAIDFDLLKQHLSKEIVDGSEERYRLDWPGKRASILKANTPITSTLKPDRESSVNFDTTENLYIEGDNFEVLKILQESYLGKIKMIYIDPPYNTGKDFVYKDNFKVSKEEYETELGTEDEEGGKLFKNTDTNGRFHSDWLSRMYERLLVARDLLTEDGVIFMSIDDNEMHNLKKISDEIFGEENFVSNLVWLNKEGGGSSDSKLFRVKREFILCYSKNKDLVEIIGNEISNRERYKGKDSHFNTRGPYYLQKLGMGSIQYSESLDYPITTPGNSMIYPRDNNKGKKACWRWSKPKFEWGLKNDFIVIKKDSTDIWTVYTKQYLKCDNEGNLISRTQRPFSFIEEYSSTQASKYLDKIGLKNYFDYTKPNDLLKYLINRISLEDEIILDFFSGSGTSADATMQLNAQDGGNRKFIMVQIPEETDSTSEAYEAGYKTISEIGKERIRRAGQKILEENSAKLAERDTPLDVGFRVYKTAPTILKEVAKHPNEIAQKDLFRSQDNIKEEATSEDILTAVLLDFGLTLNNPITTQKVAGSTIFKVDENALIACFDKEMDMQVVDTIAKLQPLRAVFRDACFKEDKDLINTVESRFKQLSPDTKVHVI